MGHASQFQCQLVMTVVKLLLGQKRVVRSIHKVIKRAMAGLNLRLIARLQRKCPSNFEPFPPLGVLPLEKSVLASARVAFKQEPLSGGVEVSAFPAIGSSLFNLLAYYY